MDPILLLQDALAQRYRIKGLLGEGGMALVYEAEDLKHGRTVAIKVLRPEVSAGLGPQRFRREIEVAARLNHPNILGLHDSGEAEGLFYFVMPFVEGESLRARLDREPRLSLDEVQRIIGQIGSALDYAHRQGLVHRDIKPENILFQEGHALVCDFGIAQVTTGASEGLTRTGMSVGTFTYMSPEQLLGEGAVDGRADVYSLGCLLTEMLTGSPPFEADTAQASLARKLTGTIPDLSRVRPDLPPTLQEVLQEGLATEPLDRFSTAGAFTGALGAATRASTIEADAMKRRRSRRLEAAAKGVAVTILGAGAWWVSTLFGGPAMDRIAVLPLSNGDDNPAQEYFVQGVHQDLVLELSKAGLRVINPMSVVRYASLSLGVQQIASELEVDGVIQGTATIGPEEIGLDLFLTDGETEEIIWSASFRDIPRNIKTLYRDATRAIAEEIGTELSGETLARLATPSEVNPQVYDALLQARFHWQQLTSEGIDTAEEYYRLAVQRDSTSAEGWYGLGQVWFMRVQQGLIPREEAERRGGPAIERARELDPTLAGLKAQHALELTWGQWDWAGAAEAFPDALAADPSDSLMRVYYSHLLFHLDRDAEAQVQMEEAVRLDPFNSLVQGVYAMGLNFLHRYEDAEEVLVRTLERDPEAPILLSTLRTTYHLLGRHEDAMRMWRASYGANGDMEALAALEEGYSEGGYSSALEAVANLFVERSDTVYVPPWQIATLFTRAGHHESALDFLEEAFEARDQNMPYISVDPIFDPFRNDPRFQAMMEGLGLPR